MTRAVVTGGTGFVGANLVRRLLGDGHETILFVRKGYSPWRIADILKHIRIVEVDLGDSGAIDTAVMEAKPAWIFHLAAHGAYSFQNDLDQIVRTNFLSTINLVEAACKIGFQAFINAGSSSEYGFKDHPPAENEWIEPNSHYAVTKAAATLFCRQTAQNRKVPIITLRLYSVFGPFEEPARLMPAIVLNGLSGGYPPLANPDVARDYVFTDDVNNAFILAAQRAQSNGSGAVYNIGSGIQTTLREVAETARNIFNIQSEPQWGSMPNRKWDTNCWVSNPEKAHRELGWQPRHSFETGLRIMSDWFRENPEMEELYRERMK